MLGRVDDRGHGRPGPGSRSKTRRSGRSRSAAARPRGGSRARPSARARPGPADRPRRDTSGAASALADPHAPERSAPRRGVLLEEAVALARLRGSARGSAAVRHVRQHPVGDRLVVARELALGDAARVEHAVGMRERRRPPRPVPSLPPAFGRAARRLRRARSLAHDLGRRACPRAGPGTTGWRSSPSRVHSVNATSATSSGSTQCAPRLAAAGRRARTARSRRSSFEPRASSLQRGLGRSRCPTLPA